MIKQILKLTLGIGLVVALGCAKKAKQDEGAGAGDAGAIQQTPMSFNSAGSDSGQIAGLNTVNFEYDSAVIDATAKDLLKANADWMKTNSGVSIQVEGHCDSRGSVEYNLALGERRAKAVKDYLASLGVASNRLTIISYGKEKLLELGDSEEVHAKNRRANFVPLNN